MAKQKTYQPKEPKSRKTSSTTTRDAWTNTMLERANAAFQHDTEQRRQCVDDMEFAFVSGKQWDQHLRSKRRNKPNYEFNRIRQLIRRVTGQQLKNKPNIKVRAVEDNDKDVADIYNGLIKNIEVQSSAENAYDTAFQWACGGGYGVLRVTADYESDDSFDQRLCIETVLDPMTCFCDPSARKFDRSDARYWFVTSLIPTETFKKDWPDADVIDFDVTTTLDRYDQDWFNQDEVRIAEYWYIEPEEKRIYLLSDGAVVDADDFDEFADQMANPPVDPQTGQPQFAPVTIKTDATGNKMERMVETNCVYSCRVYGGGKLEEPTKWGGSMIPIVPQWGDLVSINGKQIFSGMTRFGRDSQMIHNFEMSTLIEVVAKLPTSPIKATPAMTKGLESYYERLGSDAPPVLYYNVDPMAPQASPSIEPPPMFPAAFANISALTVDSLKSVTGIYDASLGSAGNESSGRAILARQNQGEVSNFVYIDNQVKALKRLGDILVDAIPHYYDADRTIRILGEDMAEKYIRINHPVIDAMGKEHIENDLGRGKFDVTVTVGKSYDTNRMELAELGQTLAQTPGPVGAIGQFILLKSLDAPGMDVYVQAVRRLLVQQGLLPPGEGDPPPAPPQPDPLKMADAQHRQSQAELNMAKAQEIRLKAPVEAQKLEAEAAETVSKIPGNEASGHQTMIQNGGMIMDQLGQPMTVPVDTNQYQNQF